MDRRKRSPQPLSRLCWMEGDAITPGPPVAAEQGALFRERSYTAVLERARALGLSAALMIAPLGLAGSVAACGGARPVEANMGYQQGPPGYAGHPPPIATIAPPGAPGASPSATMDERPPQDPPEEPEEE